MTRRQFAAGDEVLDEEFAAVGPGFAHRVHDFRGLAHDEDADGMEPRGGALTT